MRSGFVPFFAAFLLTPLVTACGGPDTTGLVDIVETHPDSPPIAPESGCTVTTAREPANDRSHHDPCSEIDYPRYPPAGGGHYATWADFGTYSQPIAPGFMVHSLEHGAVALLYNCPDGCPDVLEMLARVAASKTDDVLCRTHPAGSRVIIAPDPTLDVPLAAVAWEHVYLATCMDEPSLQAFVDEHYAQAPEDTCAAGLATPMCP